MVGRPHQTVGKEGPRPFLSWEAPDDSDADFCDSIAAPSRAVEEFATGLDCVMWFLAPILYLDLLEPEKILVLCCEKSGF